MLLQINTLKLAEDAGFVNITKTDWENKRSSLNDIQDWLRDIHKIHCSVAPWGDESISGVEIYEGNVIDVKDDWNTSIINNYYDSYYECLEDCIVFALKILKEKYGKES